MTQHRWDDDQNLLDDLSDALREAALASTIAEYGKGAFAWATVDQDLALASLSFDSSLEQVRERRSEGSDGRVLVFAAAPLSLEIEVMPDHMTGQILPPGPGEVQVEASDGITHHVEADDGGFFYIPHKLVGSVRLRCDTPAGRLVTGWVRI
jgi:hypothetical protein